MNNEVVRATEARLIGGLLGGDAFDILECGIRQPHFADRKLGHIYEAARAINSEYPGDQISVVSVAQELDAQGLLEKVGGLKRLRELRLHVPARNEIPKLVTVMRQAALDRDMYELLSKQLAALEGGAHASSLLTKTGEEIARLSQSSGVGDRVVNARVGVQGEVQTLLDTPLDGPTEDVGLPLPWGLQKEIPGGLPFDKVTILFGPTGGFKSTITNGIKRHIARAGHHVVKFGLEDSTELEHKRIIADLADIPLGKIIERRLSPEERLRLERCDAAWLENITVIDEVIPTADEMIRTYRSLGDVSAVFYDYIQLIDWDNASEQEAIRKFMVTVLRAAKADRVAQVALSQIREDLQENATEKRPLMQWVFGGKTMSKMAKLALGVWRPWAWYPKGPRAMSKADGQFYGEWFTKSPEEWPQLAEIVIRKNVLGRINQIVPVLVDLPTNRVEEF